MDSQLQLQQQLSGPVEETARRLLGAHLIRTLPDGQQLVGRLVEVEAYDQNDPASHTFRGPTPRNQAMFGPAGRAYIYFIHGNHFCFNVVTGSDGFGQGVLIRALEPLQGQEAMSLRRRGLQGLQLTNGPGKLCAALDIDRHLYGHPLSQPPLQLILQPPISTENIVTTVRIGVSQGQEILRRFYLANNPYVSRPR